MEHHDNLDLLRRAMRASTQGDEEAFATTHSDEVSVYANGLLVGAGREQLMAYWKRWFGPFPDLRLQPRDVMVDSERIFFDATMTGTHTGAWKKPDGVTLDPTGKTFSVSVVVHFRIKDGKLSEVREFINTAEIAKQLSRPDQ